jgi:hypothetical protein
MRMGWMGWDSYSSRIIVHDYFHVTLLALEPISGVETESGKFRGKAESVILGIVGMFMWEAVMLIYLKRAY